MTIARTRFRTEVIGKHINPTQIRDPLAAIDITPDHCPTDRPWIIKYRIDRARWRGGARKGRILYASFANTPAVIFAATGIRWLLHVDFLAGALPDIPDEHPAGLAVEAVPEWITQSERPDFSSRSGHADKRVIQRNRVGPGCGINVNAEHFAEQSRQALCIAARFDVARSLVVCAAAVSRGDVQIVRITRARTEADPSSVVIGLRLIEREQDSFTGRVRDIRIGRDGELRDVRHAIAKSAAGDGEVEIELSICGVAWIERHAEQTLLASGGQTSEGEKGSRVERAGCEVQNSNSPVLLHDK